MVPILDKEGMQYEAKRLADCNVKYNLFRCENDKYHDLTLFAFPYRCELQICDICSGKRGFRVRKDIEKILKKTDKTKTHKFSLLTLTLRMTRQRSITGNQVRYFNKSVRKLINSLFSKSDGCGAIAVTEIGKRFNIHAHVLVYGHYVSQRIITEKWYKITGNSYIVDIRAARDHRKATGYLLKYISKPPRFDQLVKYAHYLKAVKGVKRLHRFGIFYGFSVLDKKPLLCPYCNGRLVYDCKEDALTVGIICDDYNEAKRIMTEKAA